MWSGSALWLTLALTTPAAAADHSASALARAQALVGGGRYADAIAALTPMALDTTASRSVRARAFVSLGDGHLALGDFDAARRDAETAARGGDQAPPELRCAAEEILGSIAEAQSDLAAETAHYERSLEWADRSGDRKLVGLAVDWVFHAYFTQNKSDLALALVNARLAATPHAHPNRAKFLALRARVLMDMRDWPSAARALDEALPLADAGDDAWDRAAAHEFHGMLIWRSERDRDGAMRELDRALALARVSGSPSTVAMILNTTGNIYRGSANGDRATLATAVGRYEQALDVARHAMLPDVTATTLKNIGEVYRTLGDRPRAERALREAIDMSDRGGVTEISWMARLSAGMLAEDRDPARAERDFTESLDILERGTNELPFALGDLRAGSLAAQLTIGDNPYDRFIQFLLTSHQPERAFFVAERERARVLLDSLGAGRAALAGQAPDAFVADERAIVGRIKAAQAVLRSAALPDDRRQQTLAAIERAESELADLRLRLAVDRPALAHTRYPRLLQASDVQRSLLAPDEALVSFYLGADRSVAWVVTRNRIDAVDLPPRRDVERAVRDALQEWRDAGQSRHDAVAALSRTLAVDRLAALAGATPRLVVVPHGILYDVPIEALVDATGHPLVERFAIAYTPSASTLAALRAPPASARTSSTLLLAVANPVVGPAPLAGTRQVDLPHMNLLAPVPYSGEEARAIARLFGDAARVLEGAHARTADLQASGVERARILHFATHGLIDEERPERSALVLTADPPRDDGLLQTRDIYALRLDADLVTLSACETALGQNVSGEGMIGLTRAFFFAGARSVVASLWDVEDASTARLMRLFYERLRGGDPIDVALQRAKMRALADGGPGGRPFYWASFIVTGQARATIEPPPRPRTAIVASASIVIAAAAAVLVAIRRRQVSAEARARTHAAATS